MFVGTEVLLDVGFDVATTRLVGLIRDGSLRTASQYAYGDGIAGVARVGRPGEGLGPSRLVDVKFREPLARENSVVVAMRWEAIGPAGGLFPALDADLTLAPERKGRTALRLAGAFRPPSRVPGTQPDPATLQRAAAAAVQSLLGWIDTTIACPAVRLDSSEACTYYT